jgi:ankyrin repeat protein
MPRREDLTRDLIVAAERGDSKGVRAALAAGADPNQRGPNSYALHCAAFQGHAAIVKRLLDAGADTSLIDAQHFTALHLAVSRDHAAIAKQLIEGGAPLEATTAAGGTPLHVASAEGRAKALATLLRAGAQVDARDLNQRTPLIEATLGAHVGLVVQLLDAGAAIDARDAYEFTPLIAAIMLAQTSTEPGWSTQGTIDDEMVEYAFHNGVLTWTRTGKTRVLPLGQQRQVAKLDWAPDHLRTFLRAVDIALLLLERGADPNARRQGASALLTAARLGEPRLLDPLLARADPSVRNGEGATLLHVAAKSKRPDGLALLLDRCPALVGTTDDYGWTPAHYLCDVGGPRAMFEHLHAAGLAFTAASTKARGDDLPAGSTPIDVARHWGDAEALATIENLADAPPKKVSAKKASAKKASAKKASAKKA